MIWWAALALSGILCGQDLRISAGAAQMHQALKRLQNNVSVLHVTAHPDDEDAGLLTTLARGRGFRVALLSLTRGEGGANLAGSEMYDALGLLRTGETLAATRHYGAELYFTRAVDFGFSKRMDETLEHWGRDDILQEVVRFVRTYRPDIIVSRFHGKPRDGHGNHQAAGLMAIEAFRAAADPAQFPDAGPAWAVKKLYLSTRADEPWTLRIPTGTWDPLLGTSWRELGTLGYRQHRTQGMAAVPVQRGEAFSALRLVESRVSTIGPEGDILEGIPAVDLGESGRHAAAAMDRFDPQQPWEIAGHLARGLRSIRASSLPDFVRQRKESEFSHALTAVLGVELDAVADPAGASVAVPGQTFSATVKVIQHSPVKIEHTGLRLLTPNTWTVRRTAPDGFDVTIPTEAEPTRPYWSRKSEYHDYLYTIDQPGHVFLPDTPPSCEAEFRYRFDGEEVVVRQRVETESTDPLWGPQRRALGLVPALSVAIEPRHVVVPTDRRSFPVRVELRDAAARPAEATVRLSLPDGWRAEPSELPVKAAQSGEVHHLDFVVKVPALEPARRYTISAVAQSGGRTYTESYSVAGYRGLEPQHLFRAAETQVRAVDVRVSPGVKVAYLAGAGDETARSIRQLDVSVYELSSQDVASGNLAQFTAIVIGVRASAVRNDWRAHREHLMRYVENGGHLIVQYQTREFDEPQYGPFPYKVSARAEEVSEESAAVTILDPGNRVFRHPNRIGQDDFAGWVEERGSKFLAEWDPKYKPLLESHDRGQTPQKGGLVQAKYGKGYWTYAAYAFYRQLPAGVPGAYRLFANLLSLTATK